MTRRTYRKPQVTVSLFPFLAVLVCTMGALVVLLVLVVQQARVHATVVADPGPTEEELAEAEALDLARQDNQWRREILEQQRVEMTKSQGDHRLQLSHLEDHIRRLEEKWQVLQTQANDLESSADSDLQSREDAKQVLDQLQAAIAQTQEQLVEAKRVAEQKPRSYAIVPYRGANGTLRRPIFIECTSRGIVLQPEGLVITAADLTGPLGPGNPLDAALRATREYLVSNGIAGEAGEPYPLLVVRPGGTEAYGAARNAMKNWDDEFGYELIEAEVKLEYPAADPVLRDLMARSLTDARQRQEILAKAMPSQFGGRGSGGGGFGGDGSGGTRGGSSRGGGSRGGGSGLIATSRDGFGQARQANAGPGRSNSTGDGGSGTGGGTSSGEGQQNAGEGTESQLPSGGGQANNGTNNGTNGQNQNGSSDNPLRQDSTSTSGRPGGPGGPSGRPGGQGSGGQSGPSGGSPSMGGSMQDSRGADWALPKGARNATGVTRPVRVACWPDRLLILPEQGSLNQARIVMINNNLAGQVDRFVSEVWEHTDGWGLAIAGGYWKPVVNVEVAPGGEANFVELERLMRGSGLEVKRKSW